jgi:hypothetical protein
MIHPSYALSNKTFSLEREFRVKREEAEGRQLYLLGNDLFFQLIS